MSASPSQMWRVGSIGVLLFAASAAIGSWYVPCVVAHGGTPRFYQEQFGPAVMLACGHGYVNPNAAQSPGLDAFLNLRIDAVACSDLSSVNTLPLTSMQRAFRYLMSTVGWTWRIERRVAWSALTPLYALLYGVTIALAYAVFRQGMGRAVAGLAAAALAVSTLHMSYLAHLRDYAKAPFVLALVLLAIALVKTPVVAPRLVAMAAVAGLVTGIGVGFRNDLLVAVPAFVALFLVFVPLGLRERAGLKAAAAVVYLAAFLLTLSPMLTIYRTGGGNSSQHLVLLGLGQPFTQELGIDNGGLYDWGYDYKDELAHAMINGYADRRLGDHRYLVMYGPEYDTAASRYLADVAMNFPADMLLRVYASALNILELPYRGNAVQQPPFVQTPWILKAYNARMKTLRQLAPIWPWTIAFTFVALAVYSVRIGLFAALMVLYLSGYPALQFHERHYFHLEFIGWWAFGFALSQVIALGLALTNRDRLARWTAAVTPACGWSRGFVNAVVLCAVLAAVVVTPLAVLRGYQQRHLRRLFQAYVNAPEQPIAMTRVPTGNGWTRFDGPASADASMPHAHDPDAVHADYIVADFGGPRCDMAKIDVTFRYSATEPQHDFSRTIQVQPPASPQTTRVFLPAYYHHARSDEAIHSGYAPAGVEVPDPSANCVSQLARVSETEKLPVLMGLVLPPHWAGATLYGTLSGIEDRKNAEADPEIYTFPADLQVRRSVVTGPLQPFAQDDIARHSGTLSISSNTWHVSGVGGRGRFLHLAEMKPRAAKRGMLAVAQGRLTRGGISFGLVRNGAWVAQVPVTVPGDFAVVVQVPEDGEYEVVLSNYVVGALLRYDAVISRAGWIL